MKALKKKPLINRAEALNSKPIKNSDVQEVHLDTGDVLLTYPIRVRPWATALIHRLGGSSSHVRRKKLQLDTLGAAVWRLIDGERSVKQVIKRFSEQHQLHRREAEVAVTQFLRELGKRGLIGLK
jgi:hypothetical protein